MRTILMAGFIVLILLALGIWSLVAIGSACLQVEDRPQAEPSPNPGTVNCCRLASWLARYSVALENLQDNSGTAATMETLKLRRASPHRVT